MQRSLSYFIKPLLLAAGVCIALSGCDMLDVKNPFSEGRPKQQVVGPRHIPVLNQQDLATPVPPPPMGALPPGMMPSPPPPGALPPPPESGTTPPPQAAPVNPSDADPYDYYDKEGHPVAPKATAHEPQSRLILPDENRDALRKLLPDNRYPSSEITLAQALPSEDVPLAPPVASNTATSAQNVPHPSSHLPSFFGRLFGSGDEILSPEDKAARRAPYPSLSSVPPTPPELQAAKATHAQRMQDLENDWSAAQQDKTALDAEPSNLPSPEASAASAPDSTQPAAN